MAKLLDIASNDELASRAATDADRERAEQEAMQPQMLAIVTHIRSAYTAAREHKDRYITPRLLKCQKQKAGEYDDATRAKLEKVGGCKDYFNISETKTDALEAWIADVTSGAGELPFAVTPTPIPTLPDDRAQSIIADVEQAYQQALASGDQMNPEAVYEMAAAAFDTAQTEMFDAARVAAQNMEDKMRDQFEEGGWQSAFDAFIQDYAAYPTAFLKGPILHKQKSMAWRNDAAVVDDVVVPTWKAVSPFNIFPAPNASNLNNGPVCEVYPISPTMLQQQLDAPGWNRMQIEAALASPPESLALPEQSDGASTQALIEHRDTMINAGAVAGDLWAIEYHGAVQGQMLQEWGMDKKSTTGEAIAPYHWYEAEAIVIGQHAVRCILNPHPLGERPYYFASFVHVSNSVWGRGMLEKMADAQKSYNSIKRNMMNALAESARVQTVVDVDVLAPGCGPNSYPGKVWRVNGNKMTGQNQSRKPVDFFQFQPSIQNYHRALELEEQNADNRTLVPRYVHGDHNVSGAGKTASGFAMLMNASHKGIKRSLGNIDRGVIKPCARLLYNHNLVYLPDDEYSYLKGDCQIEARGALHLLIKEQIVARQEQFLSATNNPTDLEIMGREGRAELLRALASTLHLEHTDLIPPKAELERRAQAMLEQQRLQRREMAQVPEQANMLGDRDAASDPAALMPAGGDPLALRPTGPGPMGADNPPETPIPERSYE